MILKLQKHDALMEEQLLAKLRLDLEKKQPR